jgi:hypothetical protein
MTTTPTRPQPSTISAAAKRSGRFEPAVEVMILLAVAGMAGAASFTHVHDWTMHNSPAGTGDWFGWANAMVSELIPLAAGLEARRRIRHTGHAGIYPIGLIIGAVALSLTGQFAEATPSMSGWLIAAVPALGFLALVKLVLSSPATPPAATPDTTTTTSSSTPVESARAPIPPVVIDPAPVPAHLLSTARFAVTNHQQTTGQAITADDLAARISVPTAMAARILHNLHRDDAVRVNGHRLGA